jgi:hypothetical protein
VVEEQPEEVIEEDTGPLQAEVMAVRMCFWLYVYGMIVHTLRYYDMAE